MITKNKYVLLTINEIAAVTDYVANGSFASLKANVKYSSMPDYAVLIRLQDFNAGWNGEYVYVNEHSYKFLKKSYLVPGDIIISNVGVYAGTVFRAPKLNKPMTLGPNAIVLRVSEDYDAVYLYYYFTSYRGQGLVKSVISGCAQPKFNKTDFRLLKVPVPPKDIQIKIASVLSAYDDLIENNSRRIKILEEIAQTIYNEWFVKFRFPGHKKVKMIDSELGRIPEGWRIKKIDKYVDFVRGVEPGSKNYKERAEKDYVPFLRVGDLGSRNIRVFIDSKLTKDKILKADDIAVSLDGTVGIVKIGMRGCYSTGIRKLVIKNKTIKNSYLYFLMLSKRIQNIIKAYSKGAVILHASEAIKYMNFVLPDSNTISDYDIIVAPIIKDILLLNRKNEILQQARGILLPKLISGEIDVENLDINIMELENAK